MEEIFAKHALQEEEMRFRNPWVDVFYNWLIAGLVVLLFIGFVRWGLDIRTRNMAEEMTATALASWQAERDAEVKAAEEEQAAIKASEEYVMKQEATAAAKALFPVQNFVAKYHYSESDLITYLRCMANRADAAGTTLAEVVAQPDQFLGYSDNNPVLTEYYELAYRFVNEWRHEETKPCDSSYQWAELTPNGIYLKADFNADGYARRWHA